MAVRKRGKGVEVFVDETTFKMFENMNAAMQLVRNEVVKSISRTQRTVTSASGRKRGLSPSLPGEPPKVVEGDLRRSIGAEARINKKEPKVVGRFGSSDPKAIYLEFGTARMAARPFLRPAFARKRKDLVEILSRL